MTKLFIEDTTLTAIGDAIREKTGDEALIAPGDMPAAISGIKMGSGDIDALVNRTITEYSSDTLTTVGERAFYSCESLTTVDLPACTTVKSSGFNSCTVLKEIDLPVCTTVGNSAFSYCDFLTTVDLPACTSIGTHAFHYCTRLASVNLPVCKSINTNAFLSCTSLKEIDLPACTTVGDSAFNGGSLTTINLPVCKTIGDRAFGNCDFTSVDLPVCTSIDEDAFYACLALVTLILRSETMVTLNNINAFASTPIESGTGYIYVPSALIDTYKADTNWSTYANQFRAIEDYPEVCDDITS